MYERAASVFRQVPITRVTEISRLDTIGVPVFGAITPLAKDLTTHLGKGLDREAARTSAVMEAIERVSAEDVSDDCVKASLLQLRASGATVACPQWFDLPPASSYREDALFEWVEGWDLLGAESVWMAADLVRSPARQGMLDQVDTNGLASGISYGEAIRHGLIEVIERDIVSQHQYFELFGEEHKNAPSKRRIDLSSVPEKALGLVELAEDNDHEIVLEDLTGDLGIPVISCTLIDHAYPTSCGLRAMLFGGWGADLRSETAVCRAITEAYQSRAGVLQGARDSFNVMPTTVRQFTKDHHRRLLESAPSYHFSTVPDFAFDDLSDDVEFILSRLQALGVRHVIVTNLAKAEFQIPVVRVRVAGLSSFVMDRRRLGWRCARFLL